jgi:hypothetical protein
MLCAPRGRSSETPTRWKPLQAQSAGISAWRLASKSRRALRTGPSGRSSALAHARRLPRRNVVHGSDSVESARREIALWFRADELLCWEDSAGHWLYE